MNKMGRYEECLPKRAPARRYVRRRRRRGARGAPWRGTRGRRAAGDGETRGPRRDSRRRRRYLGALELEMDNRSRFVILVNLGNVYLTLGAIDELVRKQRRAEARGVWTDALNFEEGGSDRAKVALDAGDLCLEDGMYARAARLHGPERNPGRETTPRLG